MGRDWEKGTNYYNEFEDGGVEIMKYQSTYEINSLFTSARYWNTIDQAQWMCMGPS